MPAFPQTAQPNSIRYDYVLALLVPLGGGGELQRSGVRDHDRNLPRPCLVRLLSNLILRFASIRIFHDLAPGGRVKEIPKEVQFDSYCAKF